MISVASPLIDAGKIKGRGGEKKRKEKDGTVPKGFPREFSWISIHFFGHAWIQENSHVETHLLALRDFHTLPF